MLNGLHMLRGGAPVADMAAAAEGQPGGGSGARVKAALLRWLGRWLVPAEPFSEAFFLTRALSVLLGAGVPRDRMCLVGGVHSLSTLLRAVGENDNKSSSDGDGSPGVDLSVDRQWQQRKGNGGGYGCAAVQLGRVLLADPDFCIKVGIFTPPSICRASPNARSSDAAAGDNNHGKEGGTDSAVLARSRSVNLCDRSNRCIVGSTMALTPLRCVKYGDDSSCGSDTAQGSEITGNCASQFGSAAEW